MQISRRILLACVTVTAAIPLAVAAQDTAAQAKAREALEKKMSEMEAPAAVQPQPAIPHTNAVPTRHYRRSPQPSPAPAPVTQQPSVAAPAPAAPLTPAPAVVAAPAAAPVQTVNPEQTKELEQALRQKMNELQPSQTAVVPAQPAAPAAAPPPAAWIAVPEPAPARPVQPVQPVVVQPPPAASNGFEELPEAGNPEAVEKARERLREQMTQLPPSAAQPKTTAHASKPKKQVKSQTLPPLNGPAPAVDASKAQRLQELLDRYRADQITAEQYHVERAKILGQP